MKWKRVRKEKYTKQEETESRIFWGEGIRRTRKQSIRVKNEKLETKIN